VIRPSKPAPTRPPPVICHPQFVTRHGAQLHCKQNRYKSLHIKHLHRNPMSNQRVFENNVKFSTTQTLEMFNLKRPKPPPQVAPMVRVAKNHNLLIEPFARFVTI